jgi:hypothetical protein
MYLVVGRVINGAVAKELRRQASDRPTGPSDAEER